MNFLTLSQQRDLHPKKEKSLLTMLGIIFLSASL